MYQKMIPEEKTPAKRNFAPFSLNCSFLPFSQNPRPHRMRGFTLIELLVVVLIIGILVAVAVPQYRYIVNKSRFQQAVVFVDSLAKAQQVYRMANGSYATDITALDIALPADFNSSGGTSARSNNIVCDVSSVRIYCDFTRGKMDGIAYIYWLNSGKRACVSFIRNSEETHAFCKRFTGKQTYETYGAWSIYYIDS